MSKLIDLTGQVFGKLTVTKRVENSKNGATRWLCRCECGNEKIIDGSSLKRGLTKSCGCTIYGENIIGKKFGHLTVLKVDHLKQRYYKNGSIRGHRRYYLCQCDCGNQKVVNRDYLIQAKNPSCGCATRVGQQRAKITHNLSSHRLYNIYHKIKARCYKKDNKAYKDYGARGITMCDEWKLDFVNFYNWSMNNGYKDDLSLDRIDVNGNYEPKNCRWADSKTQNNNKRSNFLVTIYNRTQTLSEWCEEKSLNYSVVLHRISKGWSIEEAMITPIKKVE